MDKKDKKHEKQNDQQKNAHNAEPQNGQTSSEVKKKGSWQMILTVVAIIAVILIFTLPSERDENDINSDTENVESVTEENETEENESERNDADSTSSESSTEANNTSTSMTPVSVSNEFTYQFEGIEWFLTEQDNDTTAVAFKFSEFSRRAGSIVAFGNPYRLGQFEGSCQEISGNELSSLTNDTILSAVSCTAGDNTTQIALLQDATNPARVYAAQHSDAEGSSDELIDFFEVDITTIVR